MVLDGDINLLVIKAAGDVRAVAAQIRRRLGGVRMSVDAIVTPPAHVERCKNSHALVIKLAVREGSAV